MCILLINDQDARGNASAVEQVGWQADNTFDKAALDEMSADTRLLIAAEQDPVRHNDRALTLALERRNEMQEKGVVAILCWGGYRTQSARTHRALD